MNNIYLWDLNSDFHVGTYKERRNSIAQSYAEVPVKFTFYESKTLSSGALQDEGSKFISEIKTLMELSLKKFQYYDHTILLFRRHWTQISDYINSNY